MKIESLNNFREAYELSSILAGVSKFAVEFYRGQHNNNCLPALKSSPNIVTEVNLDKIHLFPFANITQLYGVAFIENREIVKIINPHEMDVHQIMNEVDMWIKE
jgi:hypothetical protein